jgi:protein TonB
MGTAESRGKSRWNLKRALLLSLALHVLAPIFVVRCDSISGWLRAEEVEPEEVREPIVFELVEPSPGPEPEVVPETNLASTKRSLARTEETGAAGEEELPLSRGESPLKENRAKVEAGEAREAHAPSPQLPEPEEEGTGERQRFDLSPAAIRRDIQRSLDERRFDNRNGSATLPGDLSFNTVDFEFAPYLLELKRRVEEKWYPPVAFRGGLPYRGASVIRFAVARGGELDLLELVRAADHTSLDTAALNAIRFAAPFPPLPEDFPEDRWVITCTFYYR